MISVDSPKGCVVQALLSALANVAKMVVDDINISGGLLGRQLALGLEDGVTTDTVATAKATKLIEQD